MKVPIRSALFLPAFTKELGRRNIKLSSNMQWMPARTKQCQLKMSAFQSISLPSDKKGISKITQFVLTWQLFVYYSASDVPVNMVAAYHCHISERSMHHGLKRSDYPNVGPRGCGLKDLEKSNVTTSKVYFNRKL